MEKYMIIHLSESHGARHAVTLCLFKVTMSLTTKERRPHRVPPFFSSPHKNRLL